VVIVLWSYCYDLFAWNKLWSTLQIKLQNSGFEFHFFQKNSTVHYQHTCTSAVINLSFRVRSNFSWYVADFGNWTCSTVKKWQTEGCWRGSGHCMNWHPCTSVWVWIWLHKHCLRFFIDLPWRPLCRWFCHRTLIWMMKGWTELPKGAIS